MEAPRIDDDQGMVEIPFSVWPSLPTWVPSTDEASPPEPIPDFGYESDLITPDAPNEATQVTYPDGGKEFRVGFALPSQDFDISEATFRSYTAGLPDTWQSMTEFSNHAGAWEPGNYQGVEVDVRVRVFDGEDGSYFSPLYHTTVNVNNNPAGPPDEVSNTSVLVLSSVNFNVTVRASEMRAASITLERRINGGSWSQRDRKNCRPRQNVNFTDTGTGTSGLSGGSVDWRLRTLTSNGTPGNDLYYSFATPPAGGGD
jgi:hypothetical protein